MWGVWPLESLLTMYTGGRQVALATELIFSVTLPCEANDPVNVLDSDESDQYFLEGMGTWT